MPALVLVVAHLSATITRVRLLTNEVEMGTGTEHVVPSRKPGCPYDLLAHEFPGYVRTADLGAVLSAINVDRDLHPTHALPLTRRRDARWDWKVAELERMQALQPSLAEILGEP